MSFALSYEAYFGVLIQKIVRKRVRHSTSTFPPFLHLLHQRFVIQARLVHCFALTYLV
jgi:hypothetical protein